MPPTIAFNSAKSFGTVQSSVILVNGAWVPQREGVLTPYTNDWIHCFTSWYDKLSAFTNAAKYVSKDENACAPAHSFCIIPKKFTIWLQRVDKCLAGDEVIFPGTPPKPSLINCFKLQPAQYPVSIDKSWIWIAADLWALAISSSYTSLNQ